MQKKEQSTKERNDRKKLEIQKETKDKYEGHEGNKQWTQRKKERKKEGKKERKH